MLPRHLLSRLRRAGPVALLMLAGCSVVSAIRAPDRRDLTVVGLGRTRAEVVAELGPPIDQQPTATGTREDYSFRQGTAGFSRTLRAMAYFVLDANTICLWELVGTPFEESVQAEEVRLRIDYDQRREIERIEFLRGAHLADGGAVIPRWLRWDNPQQTSVAQRGDGVPAPGSEVIHASATAPR